MQADMASKPKLRMVHPANPETSPVDSPAICETTYTINGSRLLFGDTVGGLEEEADRLLLQAHGVVTFMQIAEQQTINERREYLWEANSEIVSQCLHAVQTLLARGIFLRDSAYEMRRAELGNRS